MDDKKVKAGSVAVGICLFVIAILLVLIVIVFYNATMEKNNLQAKVSELETTIEEKEKKVNELEDKISKVSDVLNDEDVSVEDFITVIESKETTETIIYPNSDYTLTENIIWKLPQLKFDTEDAKKINQKLKKEYEKNIKSLKIEDDKSGLIYENFYYEASCTKDIFSLKVISDTVPVPGGDTAPVNEIYNFDIKTGKLITNEEILKRLGTKTEELNNKIDDKIKEMYNNYNCGYETYTEYYKQCDFSNIRLYIKSLNEIEAYFVRPSDYGNIDDFILITIN